MFSQMIQFNKPFDIKPFKSSYCKLTPIENVSNGVLVKKSTFTVVNPLEQYRGTSYHDFEIQNMIAVGADLSRPIVMSINSDMNVADSVERILDNSKSA